MSESPVQLTLKTITGFCGLGILASASRLAANHELQAGLLELDSPAWLEEQCRLLEEDRWAKQARAATLNRTLQTLKRKLARLSRP